MGSLRSPRTLHTARAAVAKRRLLVSQVVIGKHWTEPSEHLFSTGLALPLSVEVPPPADAHVIYSVHTVWATLASGVTDTTVTWEHTTV